MLVTDNVAMSGDNNSFHAKYLFVALNKCYMLILR